MEPRLKLSKDQLSLTNRHDALHHGERAENKEGGRYTGNTASHSLRTSFTFITFYVFDDFLFQRFFIAC